MHRTEMSVPWRFGTNTCTMPPLIYIHQFFSTAYTENLHLSHSFWKLSLKQQKHTPNLQNQTLILDLKFHKTLFAKHNTILYETHKNLTGINIMANVCFWDVFVIFWMQCFVLQEMRGILYFVCNSWICVWSFENVCKLLKKTVTVNDTVVSFQISEIQ